MTSLRFEAAGADDAAAVTALLDACGLPSEDVAPLLPGFIVARDGERIAGTIGLEAFGRIGLLRSLAVSPDQRGRGLGRELTRRLVEQARSSGIEHLYLLTTTAADFFAALGFTVVERASAPPLIASSLQFRSLCPASAVFMTRSLTESG
jgi:N-acetylglutamate synthase-like GNAT family acetyltransferase